MDIQQNPSHLSSHSPRHQERAVQVAWPAINTVRMSSLLEGWSYQQNRVAFWVEILSKLADSWVTNLTFGNPDLEWLGLIFCAQIASVFEIPSPFPFPFCTPPNGKHPEPPWPAIVLGWLGFRANPRWIAAVFHQNACVSPHKSAQERDKPLPAQGVKWWSREVPDALEECLVICFLFFLFVKKPVIVIVKTTIGSQTHVQ